MGQAGQITLLSQGDFDTYTASWVSAVNTGDPMVLGPLFRQAAPLLAATLPADQLLQLVSAVGVRLLKVGFVLQPTAPQGESAFTLALYATDAQGTRLSAYYLAHTFWATAPASGTPPAPVPGGGKPVPPKLASLWQQQWTAASLDAIFFQVPGGVLEGYDYEVGDFVQALLAVSQLDDKVLRFDFGLRAFYGPDAPATPGLTRTFGLATYLTDSHQLMVSAPYDMAIPRPPGYSLALCC